VRVRGSGAFAFVLGVALLLLLAGVPLASALGGLYEASLEGWQLVEVEVEIFDESGAPAGPARALPLSSWRTAGRSCSLKGGLA